MGTGSGPVPNMHSTHSHVPAKGKLINELTPGDSGHVPWKRQATTLASRKRKKKKKKKTSQASSTVSQVSPKAAPNIFGLRPDFIQPHTSPRPAGHAFISILNPPPSLYTPKDSVGWARICCPSSAIRSELSPDQYGRVRKPLPCPGYKERPSLTIMIPQTSRDALGATTYGVSDIV